MRRSEQLSKNVEARRRKKNPREKKNKDLKKAENRQKAKPRNKHKNNDGEEELLRVLKGLENMTVDEAKYVIETEFDLIYGEEENGKD